MRRPSTMHRAGAALAVVAALLGAGQVQVLAQRVEQGGARVELERAGLAVDVRARPSSAARRAAGAAAGAAAAGAVDETAAAAAAPAMSASRREIKGVRGTVHVSSCHSWVERDAKSASVLPMRRAVCRKCARSCLKLLSCHQGAESLNARSSAPIRPAAKPVTRRDARDHCSCSGSSLWVGRPRDSGYRCAASRMTLASSPASNFCAKRPGHEREWKGFICSC